VTAASSDVDGGRRGGLIAVGGGARSGKSAYAVHRALAAGPRRLFVATAQAFDDEMRDRIDRHIAERGDAFATAEAPLDPAAALEDAADIDVALLDCTTVWLSNLMLADHTDAAIEAAVARLVAVARSRRFPVIAVSNEVGMGIVPDNAMARRFRDLAGRANQSLAAAADEVYAAVLGSVLRLRPSPVEMVWPRPPSLSDTP